MLYICLDIGGTAVKASVLDENALFYEYSHLEVPKTLDEFLIIIFEYIDKIREKYNILGITISAPGAVDAESGIIYGASAIPYIHGPNWKEILTNRYSIPISIENDANCAALSEIHFGKYKRAKNLVLLVCGSGIGGAIIKDGKIHHGKNLHGGEFGYMILDTSKTKKNRYRNLSELASTQALVRRVKDIYPNRNLDGKAIFEEAENGDINCQNAINEFYSLLGAGIINIQYSYDPELILIGGSISDNTTFINGLSNKVSEIIDELSLYYKIKPVIKTATFKKDANLIGALAHHLTENNYI